MSDKLERFINLSRPVMYYLIIVMLIGIVIIVWMFNINKKK